MTDAEQPEQDAADIADSADSGTSRPARTSATSRARRIGGRAGTTTSAATGATASTGRATRPPVDMSKRERTATAPATPSHGTAVVAEPPAEPVDRPASAPAARNPWLLWLPAALLAAAAVVLGVLIVVELASDDDSGSGAAGGATGTASAADLRQRERVLAAAKSCVARVNTYDYRTLEADETASLKCTTGEYRKNYQDTFEKVIAKKAPKLQATQRAQIDIAGISDVSEDGRSWTILLYGQLTVSNVNQKSPRIDPVPIKAVVQRVGSQYLISQLTGA